MERTIINQHFEKLEILLKDRTLACEDGTRRKADVDEFMLMQVQNGIASFKHRHTRNYVYILQNGFLYVPMTPEPFNRGYFDYPEI